MARPPQTVRECTQTRRKHAPLAAPDPVTNYARDYSADELEFMRAIEEYKATRNRPYPTWSEVLAIARGLGYRKP